MKNWPTSRRKVLLTSLSAAPFIGGIAPKGPEHDIIPKTQAKHTKTKKHVNKHVSTSKTCQVFIPLFLLVKKSTFYP